MRKKVLIVSLIFLIFCTYFVAAETVSEKGYACLEEKVDGKCDDLTSEEKIFSLLAIDRCKTEVLADKSTDSCWPDTGCKTKTTAQAILALGSVNTNTNDAEAWLLTQEISPSDVDWLLQIDPTGAASCPITYKGNTYTVSIDDDKTISGNDGPCLTVQDDYWLKIAPSCYEEEFEISCDKPFSTSLLYKKKNTDVVYVTKDLQRKSTDAPATEKINSYCFKQGETKCNYEATLWAARALKFRGEDISSYLPYLISNLEDNADLVPESFLYSLTDSDSFKDELLVKQQEDQFWYESNDKFYDTAVALYSLQSKTLQEKTDAITWLEEVQGEDGCWQSNVLNTAFILFSTWPRKTPIDDTTTDCEDAKNSCMSDVACEEVGGEALPDYSGCFSDDVCCEIPLETCLAQGGEKCSSGKTCSEGFTDAADSNRCCIDGVCEESQSDDDGSSCRNNDGECKISCSSGEEAINSDCPSPEFCCVEDDSEGNYVWVLILGIAILLISIGIVFKAKLRKLWLKIKSKFGKGKSSAGRPRGPPRGFPPGPSSSIRRPQTPRRIFPPTNRPARRPMPGHKSGGELDNVLKKLKEMGK